MHLFTVLVGILLCLVAVNGRNLEEKHDANLMSDIDDPSDGIRKRAADITRHRRKRRQMNYGYNYQHPTYPHSYYPERRDYEPRYQQDLLPQIVKLLEEISTYVRRPPPPPPPPQPIYIPYPVPYPVPQYIQSCGDKGVKKPNVTTRFPAMDDTNQNWGFVTSNEEDTDDYGDGSRPISFDPIQPIRPMKRPAPKVEHGSIQSDNQMPITQAPTFSGQESGALRSPGMCNAAVLSCCAGNDQQQQRLCFNGFGCGITYNNGNACSPNSITNALESFKLAYSPVQ